MEDIGAGFYPLSTKQSKDLLSALPAGTESADGVIGILVQGEGEGKTFVWGSFPRDGGTPKSTEGAKGETTLNSDQIAKFLQIRRNR